MISLEGVCARYGVSYADMSGQTKWSGNTDRYHLLNPAPGGEIKALRVDPWGRFGNCVYQIMQATMLARQIGCEEIQVVDFAGGPALPETRIQGLRYLDPQRIIGSAPTLMGRYYMSLTWGPYLRQVHPAFVLETVENYVKPLLRPRLDTVDRSGGDVVVAHFRSGDIFGHDPHPFYVQPPVSYYLTAIDHALTHLGATWVKLLAEDRANPAIALVEQNLAVRGIPCIYQSRGFLEDFGTLLGATHVVCSFSTFCEAAAMMSDHIRSYFCFRRVESQGYLQCRETSLMRGLLREKNVRTFLIDDVGGTYIPPREWYNTAEQRALLCRHPGELLRLRELPSRSDHPGDAETAMLRAAVATYQVVTGHARHALARLVDPLVLARDPDRRLLLALKKQRDYEQFWKMLGLIQLDLRGISDNVALGKPATQSSVSEWSDGATPELDAAGAVDGLPTGDYSFHTVEEDQPWWMVDLQAAHMIREIRIRNRRALSNQAVHFSILASPDAVAWVEIHRKADDAEFKAEPYVVRFDELVVTRYVMIRLNEVGILHFDQVEVLGAAMKT